MDSLAPPLAHDLIDERRGSWTGDFEPSRRTSFSNSFLETPPALEKKFPRFPPGSMHRIALDEEPDLMSTPPISPIAGGRTGRPTSSYFETPTRESTARREARRSQESETSLFSNLLNKAFETVSKSGEAMDVHGRDIVDIAAERRAAKGKGRAMPDDDGEDVFDAYTSASAAASPRRMTRPTSIDASTLPQQQPSRVDASGKTDSKTTTATTQSAKDQDDEFYASHPFEAGLVDVLEATEKKVSEWWSWLSQDKSTAKV